MVVKIFNNIIFKIYYYSRKYLYSKGCLVYKSDFDRDFWSGGL